MTIQFKPNFVGTLLVVISVSFLYCSTAYAEKTVQQKINTGLSQDHVAFKIQSSDPDSSSKFAYPAITSEVFNKYYKRNLKSDFLLSKQPMIGIKVADFSHLVPRKFDKKNSFFEFAAKFNDKLQQIIAYFRFSSHKANTPENIKEKERQRKTSFIIESIE